MDTLLNLTPSQLVAVGVIFAWTGFVRTGLGFGGAALGLPLLLFVYDQPIFWLPIIGLHLLFFSGLTLRTRIHDIDKVYLRQSLFVIIPFTLIGVIGLINFPTKWLLSFIYFVTLAYALLWVSGRPIRSENKWIDRTLLAIGGYVAGTSLTGAPLIVAVFARNVAGPLLRNTLFVLWFLLVTIKMVAFIALGVDLNMYSALLLIPTAAIGHVAGLKAHQYILMNDTLFKRIIGIILAIISTLGLLKVWFF